MAMKQPQIPESAFIAPGARIVGDVRLGERTSVWHNAVIRADFATIYIGGFSNVQDNCTLHCDCGVPLEIGKNVSVGHNAVLHSCSVGDGSLIGMGAVVLNGAKIGRGCIVAAGAVVAQKTVVPDGSLFMGIPAKFKRWLSEEEQKELIAVSDAYVKLINQYK